jgi:hypothetical protein
MSTLWTILGGLLLLMSTCSIIVAVLLVVDRYRKPPWRGVTRGEVAAGVAAGLRAVRTGLGWVLRGFGLAMRWAVTVSGVTALAAAATLRIFPDLYRSPSNLGTWTGYGRVRGSVLPAAATGGGDRGGHPARRSPARPSAARHRRTAEDGTHPDPPSGVVAGCPPGRCGHRYSSGRQRPTTERLRREEIDIRPDVTADGALAWLHTDKLRDVAGQVLTSLDHGQPGRSGAPAAAGP